MIRKWQWELSVLIWLVLFVVCISLIFGHLSILLLILVIALFAYQIREIHQFERSLRMGVIKDNRKARGIWDEIYYQLYKIKKSEKRRKKKLSKMIDRFRKATDALPDAAVVLGKNTELEWINKAAKDVLGLKKSDKGQRVANLIRSPSFVNYLAQSDFSKNISIISPVNENIILQITVVPYGVDQRLLIAQDITQLKNMERMRKDFVANVSHELRTPLTVLKGYLETLQVMDEGSAPLYMKSIDQMCEQTERMQFLVNDLLLLARLETQEKNVDCVNVPELLHQIYHEGDVMEKSKGRIELVCESMANLMGDEQELRSAFTNLVVNALNYSPEDTIVKVRWKKVADKACIFEVIDQGEGIASSDIPRITERFYRVDVARSKKKSGTGLGLAIVKHVLVRHDAQLLIDSELGKGSCFSCVFPQQRIC